MPRTAPEAMAARWGALHMEFHDCYASDLELIPSEVGNTIVITFLRIQMDGVATTRYVRLTGTEVNVDLRPGAAKDLTIGGGEAIVMGVAGSTVTISGGPHEDQTYCEVLVSYYEIPA